MKSVSKFMYVSAMAVVLSVFAVAATASANDLLVSGRIDDALKVLNTRVQAQPNDAEAIHMLSRAYFHLKKWDQAISYGEKATQLAPNNSDYFMWLGRAYGEKADASGVFTAAGLAGKIRKSFERAIQIDPNNVAARTDLAEYYLEAPGFMGGGTDKALQQAQIIAQKEPARAHWVNARVAQKKKDWGTAEREFQESVKAEPSADFYIQLAAFYRDRNRWNEMDNAIAKAVAANKKKTSDFYDAASVLYESNRNLDLAADLVRRYLATNATNEEAPSFEAHYLLGEILEKKGDKSGAAKEYQTALQLASGYDPAKEALKRVTG